MFIRARVVPKATTDLVRRFSNERDQSVGLPDVLSRLWFDQVELCKLLAAVPGDLPESVLNADLHALLHAVDLSGHPHIEPVRLGVDDLLDLSLIWNNDLLLRS